MSLNETFAAVRRNVRRKIRARIAEENTARLCCRSSTIRGFSAEETALFSQLRAGFMSELPTARMLK